MAQLMTEDERSFYKSQTELANKQIKLLKIQEDFIEEQKKIIRKQTQFNKILALTSTILAFIAFLQFIEEGMTTLFFVGEKFSGMGVIVSVIFTIIFIWLVFEVLNGLVETKRHNRKKEK